MIASCDSENSATVSSNNRTTSNPSSSGFDDEVRTESRIASAADAGEVSFETRPARMLLHFCRAEFGLLELAY